MPQQENTFTTDAIFKAERLLRENNVPPIKCPRCGTGFYVVLPKDWRPGDPLAMKCIETVGPMEGRKGCGHEWVTKSNGRKR